ncbi:MAG TPA: DUF6603 domain-containing protein [Herpetosiphonaceae bacterium]
MSLSDLSGKLTQQARTIGKIILDQQTLSTSNLRLADDLDQLIRNALDLSVDQQLEIVIAPDAIPSPAPDATSMIAVGKTSLLGVSEATATIEFVVRQERLDFTLSVALNNWQFSTSFPACIGFPSDELALETPCFVFATYRAEQWTWNSRSIAIQEGLNFAALVRLDKALKPATDILAQLSSAPPAERPFVLVGPIDVDEGKRRKSPYPDLNLRAAIGDEQFKLEFLRVRNPFVELKTVKFFDEETVEYSPAIFLGLELEVANDIHADVRIELLKNSSMLGLSLSPDDLTRPLTLEHVVKLMAGQRFDAFVPEELRAALAAVAFKGFSASLNVARGIRFTSIHAILGSSGGWEIFDDFRIDGFDFTWSIIEPGRSNLMLGTFTTQFHFFPDLFKGAFEVEITTDLVITGRFKGSVRMNDLVNTVAAGAFQIPDEFVSLAFSDFYLSLDAKQRHYSLEATADASLQLVDDIAIGLNNVRFGIQALAVAQSAKPDYRGAIAGILKLGTFEVYVSAQYQGSGQGWIFEGATVYIDAPVNLRQVLADVLDLFDVALPPAVPDILLTRCVVSYATQSKHFAFTCEGTLVIEQQPVLLALMIDIKRSQTAGSTGKATYNIDVGGRIRLGYLEFDLRFSKTDASNTFIAVYNGRQAAPISIKDLVAALSSEVAEAIPDGLELDLKDVLFAFNKDAAGTKFLFGLDIGASINLSNLPLVGKEFPPDQTAGVENLQLLVVGQKSSPDLQAPQGLTQREIDTINKLLPAGMTNISVPAQPPAALPDSQTQPPAASPVEPIVIEAGLRVSATLKFGNTTQRLSLPVAARTKPGQSTTAPTAGQPVQPTAANPVGATSSDSATWFTLQKAFGPLELRRVGVQYQDAVLWFLLDGALSALGLTLSLDGLAVGSPLKTFEPRFNLRGLGIAYTNGPIEIGGAFLKVTVKDGQGNSYDEYDGTAVVKTEDLSLSAIGSYAYVNGHPSLFVYMVLDYPIGGPSFFFVTGLAGGFGYNRSLIVPPVEQIAQFPLVAQVIGKPGPPPITSSVPAPLPTPNPQDPAKDDAARLQNAAKQLAQTLVSIRQYIPARTGDIFFAIGIKFTSFKMIDSFALLTVAFGHRLEINLLGVSTLVIPTPEAGKLITPLAVVQIAFKASFIPEDGFLGLKAQLTSASYLLSTDCHLTGGFAFYSWFDKQHKGDFVLTLGGYHPRFTVPEHYPKVPRLGINWQISSELSVKGSAYFALTASALMAGVNIEAIWQSGGLKAWFKAGADFIIAWKPYYYSASLYVSIGGSYTFELAGTQRIGFDIGARLQIWGPEFSGIAEVDLDIISFEVKFGSRTVQLPAPIDWKTFQGSFLPHAKDNTILCCSVTVKEGLIRKIDEDVADLGIINPQSCTLITNSVIPAKQAFVRSSSGTAIQAEEANQQFGIGSMGLTKEKVWSVQIISITREDEDVEEEFTYAPILKPVPSALWGQALLPGVNDDRFIQSALSGFEIRPKAQPNPAKTKDLKRSDLQYHEDDFPTPFHWQSIPPFTAAQANSQARSQIIKDTLADTAVAHARSQLLEALSVRAAIELRADTLTNGFLIAPQIEAMSAGGLAKDA